MNGRYQDTEPRDRGFRDSRLRKRDDLPRDTDEYFGQDLRKALVSGQKVRQTNLLSRNTGLGGSYSHLPSVPEASTEYDGMASPFNGSRNFLYASKNGLGRAAESRDSAVPVSPLDAYYSTNESFKLPQSRTLNRLSRLQHS